MLQRNGSQWRLYPHKVRYIQHGEEIEQWALPDKKWWTDFADKWEHTEIIEFIDVDVTDDMLERYEEIKSMPEDFMEMYAEYVLTGDTSDGIKLHAGHPFQNIRLKNENEKLKSDLDNTIIELSMAIAMQGGGD